MISKIREEAFSLMSKEEDEEEGKVEEEEEEEGEWKREGEREEGERDDGKQRNVRRMIVGLGNPGCLFNNTRHNIGFTVLHSYASKFCNTYDGKDSGDKNALQNPFKAFKAAKSESFTFLQNFKESDLNFGYDLIDNQSERVREKSDKRGVPFPIVETTLLLPMKFMNLSGTCVKLASQELHFHTKKGNNTTSKRDEIIVVTDDLSIPFGQIKINVKGSAGSHNGLKDIIKKLGTEHFVRMRIGIGQPFPKSKCPSFVLSKFDDDEVKYMPQLLDFACEGLRVYIHRGALAAGSIVNGVNILVDRKSK